MQSIYLTQVKQKLNLWFWNFLWPVKQLFLLIAKNLYQDKGICCMQKAGASLA